MFGLDQGFGAFLLKIARIFARRLLFRIVQQLAHDAARMRQVEDDQPVNELRSIQGKLPGHHAAPIMAHDNRSLFAEMLDHGDHVAHQQADVVVLYALGLVAEVIAALVNGDTLILIGQPFHLVTPCVPVIGKAVNHHDQRPAAHGGVMNLHSIRVGVPLLDSGLKIGSADGSSSKTQQDQDKRGANRHE